MIPIKCSRCSLLDDDTIRKGYGGKCPECGRTAAQGAPADPLAPSREWWIGFIGKGRNQIVMDEHPGELAVHFSELVHVREVVEASTPGARPMAYSRTTPTEADWYWVKLVCQGGPNYLGLRYVRPADWRYAVPGAHYEFAGPLHDPEAPGVPEAGTGGEA